MSRKHTRRHSMKVAISAISGGVLRGQATPDLAAAIPARREQALTGAQFADSVWRIDRHEREKRILDQLLEGNLPGFLRRLIPVKLRHRTPDGKALSATIFVLPDYLAIGSDADFLRIPMNLHTAVAVVDRFGFMLPTRKIVDAIYGHAGCRYIPQPLPAGPQMTSTEYYQRHNTIIDDQSTARGFSDGKLASGHKKDVVLTNRLIARPGQIAIYGWHKAIGDPIQPLSTVHGAFYADYSHGIRMVSRMVKMDGKLRPFSEILLDPTLAPILSDEGPIRLSLVLRGA
jgi:hypothetical protein